MKLESKTQGDCLFGTSHWYGTVNGRPAVIISWHKGAAIWVFTNKWVKLRCRFDGLAAAYEYLGIER